MKHEDFEPETRSSILNALHLASLYIKKEYLASEHENNDWSETSDL